MKNKFICLLLLIFLSPAYAGDTDKKDLQDVPEPPTLPDPVESGEALEPQVTIIHKEDTTIEEYRVNGRLYMVKIIPPTGKPYYLVDNDGDGRMETRVNDIYQDMPVPQWILFSW